MSSRQQATGQKSREACEKPGDRVFSSLRARWLISHALVFLAFAAASCWAQQTAVDLDGKAVNPLQMNASRAVVLVFVREDCPVSGRYAPTIQRVRDEHQADVRFYLVFPDKSETPPSIRKYLQDFRYSIPALRDPQHALVKLAHAQVTPEAAVFNGEGALVYNGRIDNLYETFGRARPAPTTHELEDAIDAALGGRELANKTTPAVGCYIADLQ
jgi:thiol-disulfide isomerase/thioredoxin